jgi:hypothetical protein
MALMDIIGKLPPQLGVNLLDLAMEMSDLPGKDEMAGRIRKITGQSGPDGQADSNQEQAMKARSSMEEKVASLTIAEKEASVELLQERAKTEQARQREILAGIGSNIEKMGLEKARFTREANMDQAVPEQDQSMPEGNPQPNAGA